MSKSSRLWLPVIYQTGECTVKTEIKNYPYYQVFAPTVCDGRLQKDADLQIANDLADFLNDVSIPHWISGLFRSHPNLVIDVFNTRIVAMGPFHEDEKTKKLIYDTSQTAVKLRRNLLDTLLKKAEQTI